MSRHFVLTPTTATDVFQTVHHVISTRSRCSGIVFLPQDLPHISPEFLHYLGPQIWVPNGTLYLEIYLWFRPPRILKTSTQSATGSVREVYASPPFYLKKEKDPVPVAVRLFFLFSTGRLGGDTETQ